MITIELPPSTSYRFPLEPDPRRIDRSTTSLPRTHSWIALNEVVHVLLTPEMAQNREDIGVFAKADIKGYRFDYVRCGCSFGPAESEVFEKAWVAIDLRSEAEGATPPMVWAMEPEAAFDVIKYTTKAQLGSKFNFISAEAGIGSNYDRRDYFLRGFREGPGAPFWEFSRTWHSEIIGSYELHLVIRSPADMVVLGEVSLSATLKGHKFLFFPSTREIPDAPVFKFRLIPAGR